MTFIENLKSSIYDPDFYSDLKDVPTRKSFGYFGKLIVLLSFVATVILSVAILPQLSRFLSEQNITKTIELFPEDLIVTLKNNTVSTNGSEPRYLEIPGTPLPQEYLHFIVIDTATPVSLETFKKFRSMVWVAKNNIVIEDKQKITINAIEGIPDTTVSRQKIQEFIGKLRPFLKFMPLIVMSGIFAVVFVSYAFKLLYLLLLAIIVLSIAKTKGIDLVYSKAYQYSIHLITLPMLVSLAMMLIPRFSLAGIPFLFTAIAILTAYFNIRVPHPAGEKTTPPELT